MRVSLPRALFLPVLFLASMSSLLAHPGHDDGHEVTWELGHLAEHPVATAVWLLIFAVVSLSARHVLRRAFAPRAQSFRGSQAIRGK